MVTELYCPKRGCTSRRCPRRSSSASVARPKGSSDREVAGQPLPRVEGARHVLRAEARRVDRLLQVQAVVDVAQERVQRPLVLLVAAGRAEREVRVAVAQGQRRRQRGARPLARRDGVGVGRVEPEHLAAHGDREAEARHHRRAREPAAARGGGDHVAVPVDHVEMARVARASARATRRSPARAPRRRPSRSRRTACGSSRRARTAIEPPAPGIAPGRSSSEAVVGRPARGARRCRPPTAASPAARRRRPGRRRRPRGRRRRAWRTR